MIFSTIGFTALKRSKLDTFYAFNIYRKFNSKSCNNIAYKYPYKYLKCGKDYTVLFKAYA